MGSIGSKTKKKFHDLFRPFNYSDVLLLTLRLWIGVCGVKIFWRQKVDLVLNSIAKPDMIGALEKETLQTKIIFFFFQWFISLFYFEARFKPLSLRIYLNTQYVAPTILKNFLGWHFVKFSKGSTSCLYLKKNIFFKWDP